MNRGSPNGLFDKDEGTKASMRPRFMNRGSSARAKFLLLDTDASMRPRFMNRGSEIALIRSRIKSAGLQ